MKISLIALLMLCFTSVNAQLSVRNDAYLFVNDQVIYVEDDVNLEESSTRLYLRNDAQLIQGSGTTGNSGLGQLSVYQKGNTNQWEYNYWCSPVGGVLTNTSVNNSFRINQIHDPLLSTVNDLIDSNPSTFTAGYNGVASPLTISDRWLWSFVSSDEYSEWIYLGESGDLSPGLGFTMKGTGTTANFGDTVYDFRGKPNNSDIINPVAVDQITLIGNPYPSALDARDFLWDPDTQAVLGTNATLLYWDHDTSTPQRQTHVLQEYVGGYHEFTINSDGSLPTTAPAVFFTYDEDDNAFPLPGPGEQGTKTARRYIPIGQGFMVEGETNGNIIVKNAHRAYEKEGANSIFFRNSSFTSSPSSGVQYLENGLVMVPPEYKRFRINVDFTVNENQYTRQMILNFHENATMGFDYGLELKRSNSYNSDAYFLLNDKQYSAQAYPFDIELVVPLVVDIEIEQPLRFRIHDIQNFDSSQGIYLHDTEENLYVNLREQDYNLNIVPGSYTNRFEIVFTTSIVLNEEEFSASTLNIRQNNAHQQLSVLNPKGIDVKYIEVLDVTGKRKIEIQPRTILNRYSIKTANLSDGVYIVKVITNSDSITSEKIVVKN